MGGYELIGDFASKGARTASNGIDPCSSGYDHQDGERPLGRLLARLSGIRGSKARGTRAQGIRQEKNLEIDP